MDDIQSISGGNLEKPRGKASQGGGTHMRDALAFQSILFQTQLRMLSAWSDTGSKPEERVDFFREAHLILDRAMRERGLGSLPATGLFANPKIAAQRYGIEAARAFLNGETGTSPASNFLSLPALAALAGKSQGIPETFFRRLIQIESGFNPDALSPTGAMGLGQLMPETARELGLRTGDDRSEGSVWHAASNLEAAARYLRSLYGHFASRGVDPREGWIFAAAAYHAGMGNIEKAMERLQPNENPQWNRVAEELPHVTGPSARKTIQYVDRLR